MAASQSRRIQISFSSLIGLRIVAKGSGSCRPVFNRRSSRRYSPGADAAQSLVPRTSLPSSPNNLMIGGYEHIEALQDAVERNPFSPGIVRYSLMNQGASTPTKPHEAYGAKAGRLAAALIVLILVIPLGAMADHHPAHYGSAGPVHGCTWDGWNQHLGSNMTGSTRDLSNGCGSLQLDLATFIAGSWYETRFTDTDNQVGPSSIGWPSSGHYSDHNAVNGIGQNLGFRLY